MEQTFHIPATAIGKQVLKTVLLLLLCLCLVGCAQEAEDTDRPEAEDPAASLELVYALMATEDPMFAQQMLDNIMANSLYSPEFALAQARIQALEENYLYAKLLYDKAILEGIDKKEIGDEYDAVTDCVAALQVDQALLEHDSNYGTEELRALVARAKEGQAALAEAISEVCEDLTKGLSKAMTKGASAIVLAEYLYDGYLANDTVDADAVEDCLDQLNALQKKHPKVFDQAVPRLAKVKLLLIQEEYDQIAKIVSDSAGYQELMVVSELYLNDFINNRNFSKDFIPDNLDQYQAVLEHLRDVYNDALQEESPALRRQVREFMADLEYKIDNPSITKVQNMLGGSGLAGSGTDRSKVYLQLSKLEQNRENTVVADSHLANAMNTAADCTDKDYTDAMIQIIDILNNKENTENLKDVQHYVESALEHSTVVPLPENVQNPPAEGGGANSSFKTYAGDYVSQKRTSLNILNVDASKFSEVVVDVSVDSDIALTPEGLKSLLNVNDCGAPITDFTVENITLEKTNIILVCDTSGSMEGQAIENLKSAVSLFIADKTAKENIGLVTFSSYVESVYGLDSTTEELNAAVSSIYAGGGTNMYGAVIHAISMLEARADAMNIIILMSDGNDGSSHSNDAFESDIFAPCEKKEITLYSLGLGYDVDSDYLNKFAAGTNGEYLYVSDPQSLDSFYEYLHNLIANRYRITYKAVDTLSTERTVRLEIKDDQLSYDQRNYYLERGSSPEQSIMEGKTIYGLETRLLYKSDTAQEIRLKTAGFTKDDSIRVSLKGTLNYDLSCVYADENGYTLTIPSNIAVGEYDLAVTLGSDTRYFDGELVVGAEDYITKYGGYTFTSCVKKESGTETYLTGYVRMNDWLYFNGSVTLTGDLEQDATVTMLDTSGSYIHYSTDNAQGLASLLAKWNKDLHIPALGQYTLHNDPYHHPNSTDYEVSPIPVDSVYISNLFTLSQPGVSLYPFSIQYDLNRFTTSLPYQNELIQKTGFLDGFSLEWDGKFYLTNMSIDLVGELKHEQDTKNYVPVNFGAMPIYLNPAELEVQLDTMENKYSIDVKVRVAFLGADTVGLRLGWDNSLLPNEIGMSADFPINVVVASVPLTFHDFFVNVKNMDLTQPIGTWVLNGGTTVSAAKASEILPALDFLLEDVSLVDLDAEMDLRLSHFYFSLKGTVKLFGELEMANSQLQLGHIPYQNYLLGIWNEEVKGVVGSSADGLNWGEPGSNFYLNNQSTTEISITDRFIGATLGGNFIVKVNFAVWELVDVDLQGAGLLGIHTDHSGRTRFVLQADGKAGNRHENFWLTWCKAEGFDYGTKNF